MSKLSKTVRRSRQRAVEDIANRQGHVWVKTGERGLYYVVSEETGKIVSVHNGKLAAWDAAIKTERNMPRKTA